MPSVLQLFPDLLRLRARPQDLPASDRLLLGTVAAAVAASMLAVRSLYPPDLAIARIGIDLALQLAFVLGALRITGRPERFRQTFAALCGAGALLVLLTWPLLEIVTEGEREDALSGLAVLTLLAIYGWSVVVFGHILRHALDLRFWHAVALALAYILASSAIGDALVPAPGLDSP